MKATRVDLTLQPEPRRVLFRPFVPDSEERCTKIIGRVCALSDSQVREELKRVLSEFRSRHLDLRGMLMKRFGSVQRFALMDVPFSEDRKQLIGAYFTQEYSLESSAVFNPSMVWHPDQSGLAEGHKRFVLSLRSLGEAATSCITFRSGSVDGNGCVRIDPSMPYVDIPEIHPSTLYERDLFGKKLFELGLLHDFARGILDTLGAGFTLEELEARLRLALQEERGKREDHTSVANGMVALAQANYEIYFEPGKPLSARVILPSTAAERKGIEDARFVEFRDEEGEHTYYATYTAFDGEVFFPQFLETRDFLHFKSNTLNGPAVKNKGMALFPRKVNGRYAMLSRQDNENIYLMYSDMLHFWFTKELLMRPTYTWEYVQLGNCGSPIETEAGWLVLTHGVGPMRRYTIGAILLDLEDPGKVIGRLREPLLSPDEKEREGYVPNVVYSCGAAVHAGRLIIPYAMSDYASTFAAVELNELLDTLLTSGP
ncbi:MAG: glycoside hydrolase family 130 protein [Pseudomonadota bacterium]|nr:glycoside hydrolase family 130 protein [Pseudomonadota bacterium]